MTPREKAPTSRRERPAKPALSREGIVATAVAVMRAEGLEKVTMRRLAQELDTGPASLYVYVANTAELHAAVLDELLGEVDLDAASDDDWRDRLVEVLTSYTEVLFAHPALARMALSVRPHGEHYLRLVERLLALLADGGVPPERAGWGVDVLLLVATANAAEHGTREQTGDPQAEWDALVHAVQEAPAATYPYVHALAASLQGGTPRERLAWCFHVVISGITHTPIPGTDS
ncbi:TetR/AcrR family transcriptional regulator [Actinophytocola sp.]|uniref:TetR/AcrR family transcriptional regulator n=1 Tax=Actinophytocola sp. TaxID=1872138 RepID=UPI00389A271A